MEQKKQLKLRTASRGAVYAQQALIGWLSAVIAVLLVLVLLFGVLFTPVRMMGDSMQPALNDGEVLLVDHISKYFSTPKRGDAVMFVSPETGSKLIKRIVGLPGETVEVKDGLVYIDSCPLDESEYLHLGLNPGMGDMGPVTVPEGSVFVLGDDRSIVDDSRISSVGCVKYTKILGVVRARVYPFDRITLFG